MQELNVLPEVLARFLSQPRTVALVALLLAAAVIDWRTYRIPNWLTVGGMAFGLIYNTFAPPASLHDFLIALGGLVVGLVVLLPLYMLRVMGAGDVKLMAAVGAILGMPDILYAVLWSLSAGGFFALAFAIYRRAFRRLAGNVAHILQTVAFATAAGFRPESPMAGRASVGRFPYGISIALGTIAWMCARQFGMA